MLAKKSAIIITVIALMMTGICVTGIWLRAQITHSAPCLCTGAGDQRMPTNSPECGICFSNDSFCYIDESLPCTLNEGGAGYCSAGMCVSEQSSSFSISSTSDTAPLGEERCFAMDIIDCNNNPATGFGVYRSLSFQENGTRCPQGPAGLQVIANGIAQSIWVIAVNSLQDIGPASAGCPPVVASSSQRATSSIASSFQSFSSAPMIDPTSSAHSTISSPGISSLSIQPSSSFSQQLSSARISSAMQASSRISSTHSSSSVPRTSSRAANISSSRLSSSFRNSVSSSMRISSARSSTPSSRTSIASANSRPSSVRSQATSSSVAGVAECPASCFPALFCNHARFYEVTAQGNPQTSQSLQNLFGLLLGWQPPSMMTWNTHLCCCPLPEPTSPPQSSPSLPSLAAQTCCYAPEDPEEDETGIACLPLATTPVGQTPECPWKAWKNIDPAFETVFTGKGSTTSAATMQAATQCSMECPVGQHLRYCCQTGTNACGPILLGGAEECADKEGYFGTANKDQALCEATCVRSSSSRSSSKSLEDPFFPLHGTSPANHSSAMSVDPSDSKQDVIVPSAASSLSSASSFSSTQSAVATSVSSSYSAQNTSQATSETAVCTSAVCKTRIAFYVLGQMLSGTESISSAPLTTPESLSTILNTLRSLVLLPPVTSATQCGTNGTCAPQCSACSDFATLQARGGDSALFSRVDPNAAPCFTLCSGVRCDANNFCSGQTLRPCAAKSCPKASASSFNSSAAFSSSATCTCIAKCIPCKTAKELKKSLSPSLWNTAALTPDGCYQTCVGTCDTNGQCTGKEFRACATKECIR